MGYYDYLWSGGSVWNQPPMAVYLYPNTPSEMSACQPGGDTAEAIRDAAEQIYNNTQVGYYQIKTFDADSYRYPDLHWTDEDDVWKNKQFGGYLDDTTWEGPWNGTGENLRERVGAHILVHGLESDEDSGWNKGCYGFDPLSSSTYEEWGAGARLSNSAFEVGDIAWVPVCSYSDLARNAAIHETTHLFVDKDSNPPGYVYHNADDHKQGTIRTDTSCSPYYNCQAASPLATYHWDTEGVACSPDHSAADSHDQELTSCILDDIDTTINDKGL